MSPSDDSIGEDPTEAGCGHPACACPAGPSGYCSASCEAGDDTDADREAGDDTDVEREAGDDTDADDERDECACGHPGCEADALDLGDGPG